MPKASSNWLVSDAMNDVKDVREYKYMKILRFTTGILCGWPDKELKETISKYHLAPVYLLLLVKICSFYSNSLYLIRHYDELTFLQIGHNFIIVFMTLVTVVRLTSLSIRKKYRDLVARFVTEMHLSHFRNDSEYAMKTHVLVHRKSYFFSIYLNGLLLFGVILFNIHTIYTNYRNGKFDTAHPNNISFEMPIYYELPFDTTQNLRGYLVAAVLNWYSTYICTSAICMFDLMLFVMIFHLNGHFKILINTLNTFPKPATCNDYQSGRSVARNNLQYSPTEMDEVSEILKRCVNYHRLLVGFTAQISEAFGPVLFICYGFHQMSGCLILLEISQMSSEALIRYGPLTVGLFQQLITLSFIIESIGTVTGKLKDAVYGVPWEYMDTKNRKTMMILLMNVQEPLHIKAMSVAKVGVTTMASILKTSFSYYAFLRTLDN